MDGFDFSFGTVGGPLTPKAISQDLVRAGFDFGFATGGGLAGWGVTLTLAMAPATPAPPQSQSLTQTWVRAGFDFGFGTAKPSPKAKV